MTHSTTDTTGEQAHASPVTEAQARASAHDDAIYAHQGWEPYDPDQPVPVRLADVTGARNAIGHLLSVLEHPPADHVRASYTQDKARMSVAVAVFKDRPHEFDTLDEATTWLREVMLRLTRALPIPAPLPPADTPGA